MIWVAAVMNFIQHKQFLPYFLIAVALLQTIIVFFYASAPVVRIESGILKYRPALLRYAQIGDLSKITSLDVRKNKVIVQFQSGQTIKIDFFGLSKFDRPALIELLYQWKYGTLLT